MHKALTMVNTINRDTVGSIQDMVALKAPDRFHTQEPKILAHISRILVRWASVKKVVT